MRYIGQGLGGARSVIARFLMKSGKRQLQRLGMVYGGNEFERLSFSGILAEETGKGGIRAYRHGGG